VPENRRGNEYAESHTGGLWTTLLRDLLSLFYLIFSVRQACLFCYSYPHETVDDDGGHPHVKIVLIIKFARKARTNEVTGKAELYVRDAAGKQSL
jgi:hypothetical protein